MRFEVNLHEDVRGCEYVKNHHYIKLTDKNGNKLILNPISMVKYTCVACNHIFFAEFNSGGASCPFCIGETEAQWGSMQLCFVPEDESEFIYYTKNNDKS